MASLSLELRCTRLRGKAVADGAVSFLIDRYVSGHISKVTFGVQMCAHYDPRNPDHRRRSDAVYVDAAGNSLLPNAFNVILAKVRKSKSEWFITMLEIELSSGDPYIRDDGLHSVVSADAVELDRIDVDGDRHYSVFWE